MEEKLSKARLSYGRQRALAGTPGYDPGLTFDLKKDIVWLEQEIGILKNFGMSSPGIADNQLRNFNWHVN